MPARHRKKITRQRGYAKHGWGAKKKHRGRGSRGGGGMAGLLKHKKSLMLKEYPNHFGRSGFKIPVKAKKTVKAINLRDLNVLAKKLGKTELDLTSLGYDKVLSKGFPTQSLTIKVGKIVEKAKKKIEESGGKVLSE